MFIYNRLWQKKKKKKKGKEKKKKRTARREFQFCGGEDARVEHRTDAITITTRYSFNQAKEDIKI